MATKNTKKKRLGMGLSGMLSGPVPVELKPIPKARSTNEAASALDGLPPGDSVLSGAGEAQLVHVDLDAITPSKHQPRQRMDEQGIAQLADSIKASGLMQPILVRPAAGDGCYELIAGERRWRAARQAGLSSIPCIVRDVDERVAAELGIVENVQREDLDAIEKADAFQYLQAEFGLTHQEIADRVGWTRAAVTNQIRLCDLDSETRGLVQCGDLTGGHARVLLSVTAVDQRVAMAKQAIADGWSVREMERRVRAVAEGGRLSSSEKPKEAPRRAHLDDLETQLSDYLGTRVRIAANRAGNKGKLQIEFYDLDQFDGLLQRFGFKLR
jgi:ParB family chromosome partitioning protein